VKETKPPGEEVRYSSQNRPPQRLALVNPDCIAQVSPLPSEAEPKTRSPELETVMVQDGELDETACAMHPEPSNPPEPEMA